MDDVVRLGAADLVTDDKVQQSALTIDDVLRELAEADGRLPRAAMQWALDNWYIAGPRFIALLEAYASGADRSEETERILFFALHLLGEQCEAAAFPGLCRLLRTADGPRAILGDGVTETLKRIIVSTFDGDVDALKSVIETADADEFVRYGALIAMAYLVRTGRIADQEMRSYLPHLLAEMQPQSQSFVWTGWVIATATLGYVDFTDQVQRLFKSEFVSRWDMGFDDFKHVLQCTLDDPERMAGLASEHVGPFDDAIGELSHWYAFSEQRQEDMKRNSEPRLSQEPVPVIPNRRPLPKVGRNDPCPCGSGKKYKKCCLP